jgi:hypothetical protein
MSKFFWVIVLWVVIIFSYVIITAAMPVMTSITTETAETLNATSNMSNYPGMLPAVQSAPIWLYIIPGGIGVIVTVGLLRSGSRH